MQRLGPRAYLVLEKKIFKDIYGHGRHLDQWTMNILAIFCSPSPRRLLMKFEQHWPRGEVIWNYQHFFHTNLWDPYKCIRKQTWPRHKKIKCQCTTNGGHLSLWTTTILAIFHSPAPRRLHMKFEQHWPRGFRADVWNSQYFFHTNLWRQNKCILKQTTLP